MSRVTGASNSETLYTNIKAHTGRGRGTAPNSCTLPNGQQLKKAVRNEYRLLSDEERGRFHAAVNTLKRNGKYDELAEMHAAGNVYRGPAFLCWNREFLKR